MILAFHNVLYIHNVLYKDKSYEHVVKTPKSDNKLFVKPCCEYYMCEIVFDRLSLLPSQ